MVLGKDSFFYFLTAIFILGLSGRIINTSVVQK